MDDRVRARAEDDRLFDDLDAAGSPSRRMVLVPVGAWDRRAVAALRTASLIPAVERRAVHVAADPAATERLARRWMDGYPTLPPLQVVDDAGGIAAAVADVTAKALADGWDAVIVVIGRLCLPSRLGRLLHDGTAAAIARAVGGSDRVWVATVPVFAEPRAARPSRPG